MPEGKNVKAGTGSAIDSPISEKNPTSTSSQSKISQAETSQADSGPPAVHWSEEVGRRAPNWITFFRLCIVPVFVFLLVDPTPQSNLWAVMLFIVASVTDWLDGYLARIYKAESNLGTLLDPLADKILVTAALVMLAAIPGAGRVPAWMVVVMLSRELIVSGLRSLAAVKGVVVAASRWAKHKTAWTLLAICSLLIHEPYTLLGIGMDFHEAGMIFLWLAMIYSVVTGLQYSVSLRKMFL